MLNPKIGQRLLHPNKKYILEVLEDTAYKYDYYRCKVIWADNSYPYPKGYTDGWSLTAIAFDNSLLKNQNRT